MTDKTYVAIPSTLRWTGDPSPYMPERPDWQQQGACLASDPDLFFPERGDETRQAKQICSTCPVRGECLDWALATNEKFGIWGGTSERERRVLRRRLDRRSPGVTVNADRVRQVRAMRADGVPAIQIAATLRLSVRTVNRYLALAATAEAS